MDFLQLAAKKTDEGLTGNAERFSLFIVDIPTRSASQTAPLRGAFLHSCHHNLEIAGVKIFVGGDFHLVAEVLPMFNVASVLAGAF